MPINAEYQKWYDRFTKGIATKEKHIDVLLEKGVITQEEYDSIISQSGYVERGEEPTKPVNRVEQLEAEIKKLEAVNKELKEMNGGLLFQISNLTQKTETEEIQEEISNLYSLLGELTLQLVGLTEVHNQQVAEEE